MNVSLNNINGQLPSEKVVGTRYTSNHKVQKIKPHSVLVSILNKCYDAFYTAANLLQRGNIIRVITTKNFVRALVLSNLFGVTGARPNPTKPNFAPGTALAQGGGANQGVAQEVSFNIEYLQQSNHADNLQQKLQAIEKDQEETITIVNDKLDKLQMIIDSVILKNAKNFISINDLNQITVHFNKEEIKKDSADRAQLTFLAGRLYLSVVSYDTGERSRSLEYNINYILEYVLSNIDVFRNDNTEDTGEVNGMSLEKISVLDQAIQEKNPAVDGINNISTDISNASDLTKEQKQVIREKLDEIYENVIVSKRDLQEKKEALHQKLKDNHNKLIIGYYIDNSQPKINRKLANNIYQQYFPDKTNADEIINDYSQNIISQQASKIKLSHPHITTKNNHHATIKLERNGNELEVTSVIIQEKHSKEEFDIIQTIKDNKISHPTEIVRLVNELAGNGDVFIDGEDKNITSKNTCKTKKGILKQYTKMIQSIFPGKGIIYRNNNPNKAKNKIRQEL